MLSVATNFLTGAAVKVIASAITYMIQNAREARMVSVNADTDRIVKLQGGNDNADEFTRWTRRVIALSLIGLWCYVIIHVCILNPTTEYKVMIPKAPSILFSWITGSTEKTIISVSAGSLLWDLKSMVEMVCGFYLTKMGK